MICEAGSKGAGGRCDCTKTDGWTEGKWAKPRCDKGKCKTRQIHDRCKGISSVKLLGDGTWCYNNYRISVCRNIPGKINFEFTTELENISHMLIVNLYFYRKIL